MGAHLLGVNLVKAASHSGARGGPGPGATTRVARPIGAVGDVRAGARPIRIGSIRVEIPRSRGSSTRT